MSQETGAATRTYRGLLPEQRRAERRARLLNAAIDLFTSSGYHTTRIEQLCTGAGVSTRNFYEEFSNKEAVLLTLHDRINAGAFEQVTAALVGRGDEDIRTRIDALLLTFMESIAADPRLPRVAYVEAVGASPAVEQQHQVWTARWAVLIEDEANRAVRLGQAPERDYHLLAVALVGAITGILREWQSSQDPRPIAQITEAIRHIMVATITTG